MAIWREFERAGLGLVYFISLAALIPSSFNMIGRFLHEIILEVYRHAIIEENFAPNDMTMLFLSDI